MKDRLSCSGVPSWVTEAVSILVIVGGLLESPTKLTDGFFLGICTFSLPNHIISINLITKRVF